MPVDLFALAQDAIGFMPTAEGIMLHQAARVCLPLGPVLEIGTYCGKSAIYLGAAAREVGGTVFTVDHHRGSEENQPGWEHHDPTLVDPLVGLIDTLPWFRSALTKAGLEREVVAIVGESAIISAWWRTPLSMVFIDGGHATEHATKDYLGWAPWVQAGGVLAIHDVFPDPADGGRPPYDIFVRALAGGQFTEWQEEGSLRLLRRVGGSAGDPVD